jgi:hypothetical protein
LDVGSGFVAAQGQGRDEPIGCFPQGHARRFGVGLQQLDRLVQGHGATEHLALELFDMEAPIAGQVPHSQADGDRDDEVVGPAGFDQVATGPQSQCLLGQGGLVDGGHHDDGGVGELVGHLAHEGQTGFTRQVDVAHHQVEPGARQALPGLDAVGCPLDGMTPDLENLPEESQDLRLVVDDEDVCHVTAS